MDRFRPSEAPIDLSNFSPSLEKLIEKFPPVSHRQLLIAMQRDGVDVNSPEAELYLKSALKKRDRVKDPHFTSDLLKVYDRVPPELRTKIRNLDDHATQIDSGFWGRVMRCNPDQADIDAGASNKGRLVYKFLHTPPVGVHNSMLSEAGYLAELHALAVSQPKLRIGVPTPYFFIMSPEADVLVMEDISHAVSIKNIIAENVKIPEKFPLDAAFNAIRAYVALMHANNFYHRDLREGNIMLNLNAEINGGEPLAYIIDTGFCIKASSETESRKGMDKTPDNGMINLVEQRLKNYLQNREHSL